MIQQIHIIILVIFSASLNAMNVWSQDEVPGAEIKYITVDPTADYPGRVRIEIDTSGTLITSKFQIRKYFNTYSDTGYLEISTLIYGGSTTYYDNTAQAHLHSESYDILTYDTITNDASSPSTAHATMYLELTKNDSCNKRHVVDWSEYTGNNVLQYQIFVNGSAISKYESTTHSQNVEFNEKVSYQAVGLGQGF